MTAAEYYKSHAIDPSVAERCGVRAQAGRLVYLYRRRDGTTFDRPRSLTRKATWQPAGEPLTLYVPYRTKTMKAALLCEGEPDTLAAISALKSLVIIPMGIPGVGMPTERICNELEALGVAKVWMVLDGNKAGQDKTDDLAVALPRHDIQARRCSLPKDKDLSDCLAALGPGWLTTALKTSKPALTPELRARLYASLSPAEQSQGVDTRTAPKALRSQHSASEDPLRAIPAEVYVKHFTGEELDERRKIHCPFHEDKTPSFHVYPGDGGWFCHGACQKGGSIYDFAMLWWRVDFKRAKERLEEIFDVAPRVEGQEKFAA
jgi:DNA primase